MKLLTRLHQVQLRLFGSSPGFTLALLAVLVPLELVGRQSSSDLHDAVAALVLGFLGVVIGLRHRQNPLPWVDAIQTLLARLGTRISELAFEIGIDLRGKPDVPRGYPPAVLIVLTTLVALGVLGLTCGGHFPQILRWFGLHVFYLGYLMLLIALWSALVVTILLATLFPVALIHDAFVGRADADQPRSRRGEWLAIGLYFGVLIGLGVNLPVSVLLAYCLVPLLVNLATVMVPANADVQLLWKPRQGGPIRAIPWGRWATGECAVLTLALLDVALLAVGDRVFAAQQPSSTMPLTSFLGSILAWWAPGVLTALMIHSVLGRWRDPARSCRPTVVLSGPLAMPNRQLLLDLFSGLGWRVRFGDRSTETEAVPVQVVEPFDSQATEFEVTWPLAACLGDLNDPMVQDRLVRRDEIQKRRKILTALERLFKLAHRRKFRSGHGYWLAPHFWFIAGLSRDEPEEDADLSETAIISNAIGPPYHRLMSRAVRHHLYRMLRALEVDLIFVEDGVNFAKLKRVLRVLFEVYDRHAGKRRAEDNHFTGLPKTRVVFHEFTLDEPFKMENYPEPKYENLGRARILHVFRDRGEQDEPLETPFDFSSSPVPLAAI